MTDYSVFQLGDFKLVSGENLPNAFIAYKTFGNASNPAIIFPTHYSGLVNENEWLIGTGMALDPARYYIIIPALFGNGQSISPSNTRAGAPATGKATGVEPVRNKVAGMKEDSRQAEDAVAGTGTAWVFPNVTFRDNVTAQYRLVTEHLGVQHARLVLGWSMGAGQTYQWLTQYPDFMDLGAPFCGSARTSIHNQVFLEGVKVSLLSARGASSAGCLAGEVMPAEGGSPRGWTASERLIALKAMGRVYAGWGMCQDFYRHKLYTTEMGFKDLEDFLINFWEKWTGSNDPEDLLVMLHTWQAGDCSDQAPYHKDFELAMRSIKAKTLVLPGIKDLYFPPEDSEYEVQCMSDGIGTYLPIPSLYGHMAGAGVNPVDTKWIDDRLKEFLAEDDTSRPGSENEKALPDMMAKTRLDD